MGPPPGSRRPVCFTSRRSLDTGRAAALPGGLRCGPSIFTVEFVTIPDVELCSAGMNWPSASGPVTLTLEHIADCVRAGEDPLITPPRLKIGHVDPRFADPEIPDHDPFYDGEPAFGTIANLRLTNDGATAVGDYIYMPKWLAEGAPAFYPSRSIEGAYSIEEGPGGKLEARWDVETPGGKKYSFVLTACSLLGVQAPAVKDIEDLQFRLTEGRGVIVTGDPEAGGVPIGVSMSGVKPMVQLSGGSPTAPVSLEADVDKVIDVFYSEFCVDERYWWWARAVRVDPNVIIADDDKGSLWSVPIETDGEQNITFGTPTRVLQTFTPAPEAAAQLQSAPQDRKERPEGGGSGSGNTSGMNFSELSDPARKRLCAAYGLSEDATDEQIEEAVQAEPEDPATGGGNTGGGEGGEPTGGGDPAGGDDDDEDKGAEDKGGQSPPAASEDSPTVPVDKTVLAQMASDAEAGRKAREQQVEEHRATVLKAALKDGKITPASKDAWEAKLKAAPEATEAELDALPKNLVPVEEVGNGGGGDSSSQVAVTASDMELMFPGHVKRKAA
jgi:hypothetical protein